MRSEGDYERPIVEPENLMTGGFQSGRFDASPRVTTGRSSALWALVFAVLWIFGIGSLVAVGLAVLALASGNIGPWHRRFAVLALVLSVPGIAASVALVIAA